jgi:hypothetical protein
VQRRHVSTGSDAGVNQTVEKEVTGIGVVDLNSIPLLWLVFQADLMAEEMLELAGAKEAYVVVESCGRLLEERLLSRKPTLEPRCPLIDHIAVLLNVEMF